MQTRAGSVGDDGDDHAGRAGSPVFDDVEAANWDRRLRLVDGYLSQQWRDQTERALVWRCATPSGSSGECYPDVHLPADFVFPFRSKEWILRLYWMDSPEGFARVPEKFVNGTDTHDVVLPTPSTRGFVQPRTALAEPVGVETSPEGPAAPPGTRPPPQRQTVEYCQIIAAPVDLGDEDAAEGTADGLRAHLVGRWYKRVSEALTAINTAACGATGKKGKKPRHDKGNSFWLGLRMPGRANSASFYPFSREESPPSSAPVAGPVRMADYFTKVSEKGKVQVPRKGIVHNPPGACFVSGAWHLNPQLVRAACEDCYVRQPGLVPQPHRRLVVDRLQLLPPPPPVAPPTVTRSDDDVKMRAARSAAASVAAAVAGQHR